MFKALPLGIALLCTAFAPGWACAQIYKWTDDNGRTVYSNTKPGKAIATKTVEVVVDEDAPSAPSTRSREQELLDRISRLERELASRQYPPQPPVPPPYYAPYPDPANYYPAASYYPPYYAFAPGFIVARPRFVPRIASFHGVRTTRSFSTFSGRSHR
jgi:hypothetical protein